MNISLAAEPLFHIGTMPITNTLAVSVLVTLLLAGFGLSLRRKLSLVPAGAQNVAEVLLEGAFSVIDSVTHDRRKSERFLPIVFTIFLFVIVSNWSGLLPGLGTVGLWGVHGGERAIIPFLRAPSADLNLTLAIAAFAVVTVQVVGIATIGLVRYGRRFITFRSPVAFGVGLLELILEAAKVVSFSFRLFGNIFAGEVLLVVVVTLVPYLIPLPFLALELFVGFVQALVFAMLTLVFLQMATVEGEH